MAPPVWLAELPETVVSASSGHDALEILHREDFDGVLMDCQMPGLDGYATTRALRTLPRWQALPVIAPVRSAAYVGALISYGLDGREMLRLAASYADRLLKGTKPADLPIEQPTRFELVVNLKAAKTLGLRVPQSLRLRADEVIE